MSGHLAATVAYVRTQDGVVKVAEGDTVPDSALPEELARLASAGVIVAAPEPEPSAVEPSDKPKPPGKGKPGS